MMPTTSKKHDGSSQYHPDGGWGWVVALSCNVMLQLVLVSRMSGVFFNEWKSYFDASAMAIGSIGSIHMAAFLFMGPFGGFLCRKIGPRKLSLFSGVTGSISILLSSQSQRLVHLILSFGVAGGMCLGFGFICTSDILSKYFKKRFGLANSISNSGSGIGMIVLPLLSRFLIDLYSWNGAMLVFAAISGNICVCAMLFRPVAPRRRRKSVTCESTHHSLEQEAPLQTEPCQLSESISHGNHMPTEWKDSQSGTYQDSEVTSNGLHSHSDHFGYEAGDAKRHQISEGAPNGQLYRMFSESSSQESETEESHLCMQESQSPGTRGDADISNRRLSASFECEGEDRHQCAELSERISANSLCSASVHEVDPDHIAGSHRPCPEEPTTHWRSIATYDPVTNAKQVQLNERRPTRGSIYVGHFVKGTGLYLFQTNYRFRLFCFMQIIHGVSFTAVIIHFVPCAISQGVSKLDAALLLSFLGTGSVVGRLASGPLVDFGLLTPLKLYFGVVLLCGMSLILLPAVGSYTVFVIFAVLFGYTSGTYKCLNAVLLRQFVGGDRLATATGMLMPFIGIGNIVGPIFAGWLYDIRDEYDLAFFICGGFMTVQIFLLGLMPHLEKVEKRWKPQAPVMTDVPIDEPSNDRVPLGSAQSLTAL